MNPRRVLTGLALAAGCGDGPQLAEIQDHPTMISATVASRARVDALLPSDLMVEPGGATWVLDGYAGRALQIGPDGEVIATIGDPATWGHPLRMAQGDDGRRWLSDPAGRLLQVDAAGLVVAQLPAPPMDGAGEQAAGPSAPVALLDLGDALVVSDRAGRVSWLDPVTGAVQRQVSLDAEGERFSLIADLSLMPDGRMLAVDTLLGRVHVLSAEGEAVARAGRYGAWVGYLKQPKAVLALEDGAVAVADSELGAVQIFDEEGVARGVIAVDGAPLRLAHPVALERGPAGELLVLDAGAAEIIRLQLDGPSLEAALDGAPRRWLRTPLAAADPLPPLGGERCVQCHSGVVNDSREVWDPKRDAHPVNIKPEKAIPAYFPLSDTGQLVCTTCHSPHGSVSLAELEGASPEQQAALAPREQADTTFLRMGQQGSELCVACHTEAAHEGALEMIGLGGGGHPTGQALVSALAKRGGGLSSATGPTADPTRGQCLSCHAVHGATGPHLTRDDADGAVCVACHQAQASTGRTHPMGEASATDAVRAAKAGLPLDAGGHVSCQSCHALLGGEGDALLRRTAGGSTLCASCHTSQASALGGGHARLHGAAGLSCLSCHDVHGLSPATAMLRGASSSSDADPQGCLSCHGKGSADARRGVIPGVLGHPVHGEVHGDSALTCETCHDAHDPRPSRGLAACEGCHAEQASAAHRGGHGQATCLDCHPMHSAAPSTRLSASVNPSSATCLACHAATSANAAAPKLLSYSHPEMVFTPDGARWTPLGGLPLFAADGSPQPAGQNGALTCSSCHLTHGPDAAEPGDNLRRPGWREACAACHGEKALPLYRYFHRSDRWDDLEESP